MNRTLISYLVGAVLAVAQVTLKAQSHRCQMPDGLVLTMEVQSTQTMLTLVGQPFADYRIEATGPSSIWSVLARAVLDASGTFSYADTDNQPMRLYRVISSVTTNTFVSIGTEDGRVTDRAKSAGIGASVMGNDSSASALRAGDVVVYYWEKGTVVPVEKLAELQRQLGNQFIL